MDQNVTFESHLLIIIHVLKFYNDNLYLYHGGIENFFTRYYKRAYQELFVQSDTSNGHDSGISAGSKGCISDYHQFGWLLFLALRMHGFGHFKDLVTCTNGLVSILVSPCSIISSHILVCFEYGNIWFTSKAPYVFVFWFFRLYLFFMYPSMPGSLEFKIHQFLVDFLELFTCIWHCEFIFQFCFLS